MRPVTLAAVLSGTAVQIHLTVSVLHRETEAAEDGGRREPAEGEPLRPARRSAVLLPERQRLCVFQEWKERYESQRDDHAARNRSSHEMKETSYCDSVGAGSSRREGRYSRPAGRADRDRMELLQDAEPLDFSADSMVDEAPEAESGR